VHGWPCTKAQPCRNLYILAFFLKPHRGSSAEVHDRTVCQSQKCTGAGRSTVVRSAYFRDI